MMPHVLGIKKARENNKNVKKPIEGQGPNELITDAAGRKNMEERSVNTDLSGPNQQNAIVQTVAIDYEPTRIEISDNNQANSNNKTTPGNKQQKRGVVKAHEDFLNENLFFGSYQPPALFFNSELDGRQNTSNVESKQRMVNEMNNKKSYLNFRMEYLSVAVRNQEFIEG